MDKKSYFYDYVAQLRHQEKYGQPMQARAAANALAVFSDIVQQKLGKPLVQLSLNELKQIPFDLSGRQAAHIAFWGGPHGNFLGIFGKKNREKRKKIFGDLDKIGTKIGEGLAKAAKALPAAIKSAALLAVNPAMASILPFIPFMRKELKRRNVSFKEADIANISKLFFEKVVQKKNYEDDPESYEHVEFYETHYDENGKAHVAPIIGAVVALIPKIIKFIKNLIAKKKAKKASAEEAKMAEEAEKSEQEMKDNPAEEAKLMEQMSVANQMAPSDIVGAANAKKGGFDPKIIMYVIGAVVAAKLLKIF